jgi:hypothetical protein
MQLTSQVLAGLLTQVPNAPPTAPTGGLAAFFTDVIGWAKWLALGAGVVGLAVCAIMMVVGHRNRHQWAAEGATGVVWVVFGVSVVALSFGLVNTLFTTVG